MRRYFVIVIGWPAWCEMRFTNVRHVAIILGGVGLVLLAALPSTAGLAQCTPLPRRAGPVVEVFTAEQLQNAVASLTSNTTILLADGVYDLTHTLNIDRVNGVTIRGASGNRDAVIVRGRGMSNRDFGSVPHVVGIYGANDVTLADMTLRDAYYHLIQVHGEAGPQRPRFHNLHLIDSGEQFIKGSTSGAQRPRKYSDGGLVECSVFEYTSRARSDYTNAVDVLAAADWIIRDNVFRQIRGPLGHLAGPTVLMWRNSLNTLVERNLFVECDRAVALGLSPPDANARGGERTFEHQGGIVRNNMIYRAGNGDVGLTVNYAKDYKIYQNTVILNGTFPWAIEYRFSASTGSVQYNLADGAIRARDGAQATLVGNITNANASWFVNEAVGDLHLSAAATASIDHAGPLDDVTDDYDGDERPVGGVSDVGADEYRVNSSIH